ncbi:MAG: hypothetical protein OXU74_16560 [Gemmatimonadota bacterium]|nr:hypothetical protein [Gemmatimonadota bacterium]
MKRVPTYRGGSAEAPPIFVLALTIAATGLIPFPLAAQNTGDRVRVTTSTMVAVGEVTTVNRSGFQVQDRGALHSFSYDDIARLERSAGRQSQWKRGLMYGGGTGVGAGVLYGALVSSTCDVLTLGTASNECAETGAQVALLAGLTWGAAGGLVGAGVGALIRREAWDDIPFAGTRLSLTPIVAPRPSTGGVSLGLRILH